MNKYIQHGQDLFVGNHRRVTNKTLKFAEKCIYGSYCIECGECCGEFFDYEEDY